MPNQRWAQLLEPIDIVDATPLTAAAEGLLVPDRTVPGGFMTEDRVIRVSVRFKYSNAVTTPGSITFRIRWGGLTGTILAQTSAIPLNVTAQTSVMGFLRCDIVCRARGATGSLLAMGSVELAAQLAASNNATAFMGSAGGASGNVPAAVVVNTLVDTLLSVTYQSTVATGSITGMLATFELLN